ncbi:MAG: sterol desaturase family protein [Gammaproteobacteria bacterium]
MPNPIEILTDPLSLIVLAMYAALWTWEKLAPARSLPAVRGWWLKGLAAFFAFFFLSTYLPLFWDTYLAPYQLLDMTGLGTWGGGAVGLVVYETVAYGWHRAMHGSNLLWRGFHQMHHSSERLDVASAYWFSPMDMVGWTAVGSVALVLGVGVTPQAATLVLLTTTFLAVFQHANIATPRWLGYFVQRPEMHSVHHGRGVHRYNYADLPVFDMVFGTFRNPATFTAATGFYDGASARVTDMVLMRDVSRPPAHREAA